MNAADGRNAHRLEVLAAQTAPGSPNAISSVEVRDSDEPVPELRQRTVYISCIHPIPTTLDATNVLIDGGERVPVLPAQWALRADTASGVAAAGMAPAEPGQSSVQLQAEWDELVADLPSGLLDRILVARTDRRGDFSRYTLRLIAAAGGLQPPAGFDPVLSSISLRVKIECPTDFDCEVDDDCVDEQGTAPELDYLAKDYTGFRRVMLERMGQLSPTWTERSAADLGVVLVESLAYVADQLSYRQDAIATEAYLATARRRVSLRRLARLVDYRIHEGSNARAWLQVTVDVDALSLPAGTKVYSRVLDGAARVVSGSPTESDILAARPTVYETVDAVVLRQDLGELDLYGWGAVGATLPAGATSATLRGAHPGLLPGDVLVLAETASPETGLAVDADPARRWAVRLTAVRASSDPSGHLFDSPPSSAPLDVTEIDWAVADALPTALCLDDAVSGQRLAQAWGNIVLADHGEWVRDEVLGSPAPSTMIVHRADCGCGCGGATTTAPVATAIRWRPAIARAPLTRQLVLPAAVLFHVDDAALLAKLVSLTWDDAWRGAIAGQGIAMDPIATVIRGSEGAWSISDGVTILRLRQTGATQLDVTHPGATAADVARTDPRATSPQIQLTSIGPAGPLTWVPQYDLLGSGSEACDFVVETEHDGSVTLRFAGAGSARHADADAVFSADYRVGNGIAGELGVDSLAHLVSSDTGIIGVTNPLPSSGAADPESRDEIVRDAPEAYTVQQRAVTDQDYADLAGAGNAVQRAASTRRWTGSWHTVYVTADRLGGLPVDAAFETVVRDSLEPYRMAGLDLEIDGAVTVPLEIELTVCAAADQLRGTVKAAVLRVLGDAMLPTGGRGLFHPDNFTFGQPVYLSSVIAAAAAVPGVVSVEVPVFQRLKQPVTSGLESGRVDLRRLEIARLDNDPNFPERGLLTVTVGGGR